MGDPRKLRNKYERPKKLWDVDRLRHDKALESEYGLKNMRELWRATAELKKYRREARRLLSLTEEERKDDAKKILVKLAKFGILKEGSAIDDVLSLEVRAVLERRLQTMVLRKGLAVSSAQSRQLITHGFIAIKGKIVTRPGYLVNVAEELVLSHAKPIELQAKIVEESTETEKPEEAEKPKETKPKEIEKPKEEKPKESEKPKETEKPEETKPAEAEETKPKEAEKPAEAEKPKGSS
ncbi:MAG: 30S ribosomal protein S4 [Candidatus Micrarchaeota archaeon]